ncbi:MAG TPA: glycosyl transferase, partial [Bacteroidales bacterium]|nr:glycosyl transferase [Bacteroidales bacterium]
TVVFLLIAIITGFLLTPHRKALLQPSMLKAAFIGLIIVLPNIIWQVRNNFPVIDHMRVLKESQLDNNSYSGFLKGQALFLAGSIPLIICGLYALFAYKPFRLYRIIGISFTIVLLTLTLAKAKDYYSLGLYPVIFSFGAVFLEKSLRNRFRSIVLSLVIAMNLIVFVFMLRFVFPVLQPSSIVKEHELFEKTGTLRWEDGRNHMLPQDFSDMTGWREMAAKALTAYRTIPVDQIPNTLVFCDNYGQTGALNYYNRGLMKEAYSFNTDYIYWMPRIEHIKNVLLVGEMPEGNVDRMFRGVVKTDSVTNEYAREKGTGIFLFTDADSSFTSFFYNELERRKRELDIF